MSHQPEALLWSSKSLDPALTFEKNFEGGAQEGFRALSQEHIFLLDVRPTAADTNWLLGQRLATRSTVSSTVVSRIPLRRTRITRVTASSQELVRSIQSC